jgi:hypothetical protein
MDLIQSFDKKQVGHLLNDLKGVGYSPGPERIPDTVNFIAYITSQHSVISSNVGVDFETIIPVELLSIENPSIKHIEKD